MQYITSIEIENFKGFDQKVTVSFDDLSVLVRPNNAGKTTIFTRIAKNTIPILGAISIVLAIAGSMSAKYIIIYKKVGFRNSLEFAIPIAAVVGTGMIGVFISF